MFGALLWTDRKHSFDRRLLARIMQRFEFSGARDKKFATEPNRPSGRTHIDDLIIADIEEYIDICVAFIHSRNSERNF